MSGLGWTINQDIRPKQASTTGEGGAQHDDEHTKPHPGHWIVQVTIGNNWCTLIADAANKEDIALRVQQIKKELAETDSVYDTEKLSERIAKLAGGVAVIKVHNSDALLGIHWHFLKSYDI